MRKIITNKGLEVLVDDEDFEHLSQFKWRHDLQGYVVRSARVAEIRSGKIKTRNVYLHREVMGFPASEIDHIDQNKLNNMKANLRKASRRENALNMKKRKGDHHSRFKGVTWHSRNKMWIARVRIGGKMWGKCFHTEIEAARAYNEKAREVYGPFVALNEV